MSSRRRIAQPSAEADLLSERSHGNRGCGQPEWQNDSVHRSAQSPYLAAPRPLRPATWVRKVRSDERISGKCRDRSALSTPTRVTLGKSKPLATIWYRSAPGPALSELAQDGTVGPFAPRSVRIQAQGVQPKLLVQHFLQLLCTHPKLAQVTGGTARALVGRTS